MADEGNVDFGKGCHIRQRTCARTPRKDQDGVRGAGRDEVGGFSVVGGYLRSKLKHYARALKCETHALYLAYRDPRVPLYAKMLAAMVVGYAFSPLDLIPAFIPALGYLEYLILVPAQIALVLKMIPAEVMNDCRTRAAAQVRDGKPLNRAAGAIVVLIWLLLAALSVALVVRLLD